MTVPPTRPRTAAPARRTVRHRVTAAAAALAVVATSSIGAFAGAAAASEEAGTLLLEDNFMSSTTVAQSYRAGGRNFTACLTAGASTSTQPIPGCGLGPLQRDAEGNGALRLTAAVNNQAGFLLYDRALPTKAGLDITFNQYQWGGTLADGISFFLTDGAYTLNQAGAYGGSLGYHHHTGYSGAPDGVSHGLLGVGFDVWGNYSVETNDIATCGSQYVNTDFRTQKNTVAVRGPGNGKTGYCLLGPTAAAGELAGSWSSRPQAVETRIIIDPPSRPSPQVRVYLNDRLVTTVPQPAVLATTPTFKFGWAASTGGSNNNHEINFLSVESVDPILPDLGISATASDVPAQSTATVTLTARADAAAGPVPEGEPVTVSAAAPAGATFDQVGGNGWDCSATTGASLSCTATSVGAVAPGTTFPPITATLARDVDAPSGVSALTATISSPSDDTDPAYTADNTVVATVRWNPVAQSVDAGAVDASATPVAVTQSVPVIGTAPYTYAVSAPAHPAVGTVAVDANGVATFTPAAGASGPLVATYTATDPSSGVSNTAELRLTVRPVAPSGELRVHGTETGTTTLDPAYGSGPFTATGVTAGTGIASAGVVVVGGAPVLTVTAADGYSGRSTVTYTLVDGYGVASAPVSVDVVVHPVAGDQYVETTLDADGAATATLSLTPPPGDGDWTWAPVGDLDLDGLEGVTLGADGILTAVTSTGVSGSWSFPYTVSDGVSVSEPATIQVLIRPYLGQVDRTSGTADAVAVAPAPVAVGSDLTYTHTATLPPGVSYDVSPAGVVTLDPDGASGTFTVELTATDADGVTSAVVPVVFDVAPVASALTDQTVASADPAAVVLTPSTVGTGPFTYSVVTAPDTEVGTVTVEGDTLVGVPAPGYSGPVVATYVVTDGSGLESAPVTVTVGVRPAAHPTSAEARSGQPATIELPAATGTGPFGWDLVEALPAAAGTVEVSDGEVRVHASPDYSGPLTVRYTVTDDAGLTSDPAQVDITVRPVAPAGELRLHGVMPGGTALEPVLGSGPFTVIEVVAGDELATTDVSVDADGRPVVTATAVDGFSGPTTVTYTVTDGSGVQSAPVTVDVVVHPVAVDDQVETTLDADGTATVALRLPTPSGQAPFTWELDDDADLDGLADVTLTADGALTVVAATGVSGSWWVPYTVSDGVSVSRPAAVHVVIRPYLGDVAPTVGTASGPLVAHAPVVQGTGVVFAHTVPVGTSVAVSSAGVVTLDTHGASGTFTVELTAVDADGVTSEPVTVTFVVAPVAAALVGHAVASPTPAGVDLAPVVVGTGPYTYTLVDAPAAGTGTASVVDGSVVVVPADGYSGPVVATYTATDVSGLTSAPVTATVHVRPAAHGTTGEVRSGHGATIDLPEPTGTGPYTWTLVDAHPGEAAAVVVTGGQVHVEAASDYSGPVTVRYTVTDAAGLTSDPAQVDVAVVPVAPSGETSGPVTQPGTAGTPVSGPVPTPSGSGPFTFVLTHVPDPSEGTATIDPDTGVITFVPAPGFSGTVDIGYQAIDVHGTPADDAWVEFVVVPAAVPDADADVPGTSPERPVTTEAGRPVTITLPQPVGTGPFTFELVEVPDPSIAQVVIDPVTGEVTVVPVPGWSGVLEVSYRVVDASGVASEVRTLHVSVQPVAAPFQGTYTPGTTSTVQLPAPVGTGPFTWSLVAVPPAAYGTVTIDAATGVVTFEPAPGFIGAVELTYVVTDADGVSSDPATVVLQPVLAEEPPVQEEPVPGEPDGDTDDAEQEVVARPTTPSRSGSGALARTGAETGVLALLALGLVLGGVTMITARRPRA